MSFNTTDECLVRVTKSFQGLVSHELTAYLSDFDPFFKWPYYPKDINRTTLNHTTL